MAHGECDGGLGELGEGLTTTKVAGDLGAEAAKMAVQRVMQRVRRRTS